jgi:hypothetical protein
MEKIAAILICAHIFADFLLQTGKMANNKRNLSLLFLHAAIHAVVSWLLLQAWAYWQVPLYLFAVHALIDYLKERFMEKSYRSFIADQTAHLFSLVLLSFLLAEQHFMPELSGFLYKATVVLAGLTAAIRGSGFLINLVTKDILEKNQLNPDGLIDGGKLIGQLERGLIFLFIFINLPTAIGFLVTAKSILRFEEARKQKLAEYILIGTLLSFSTAIAIATLTMWATSL